MLTRHISYKKRWKMLTIFVSLLYLFEKNSPRNGSRFLKISKLLWKGTPNCSKMCKKKTFRRHKEDWSSRGHGH